MCIRDRRSSEDKLFYSDLNAVAERAAVVNAMGFDWTSVNATAIFQSGSRSVGAIIDRLAEIYSLIQNETER